MDLPHKNIYKIYINLKNDNDHKYNICENNFFDYFMKINNIDSIKYNNLLDDIYIILNHNEYVSYNFFKALFEFNVILNYSNKILKFVNEESDCDIKISFLRPNSFNGNIIISNMKSGRTIRFGIEHDIPIPYFTGLYLKSNICKKFNNRREYLISYIGGIWRGEKNIYGKSKREIVINKFLEINNNYSGKIFYAPLVAESHHHEGKLGWEKGEFGKKAKLVYINSTFSWQPYGDTPTRRAFYEALLCGNIPIISKTSYSVYKNLLIGEHNLNRIAIVLDDSKFYNGEFIINYLLNIDEKTILLYKENIDNIKDRLQWNIFNEKNAFHDMINIILDD